jgi:hypothetical protein
MLTALSPEGDESSPRGRWSICAPALPEVLTSGIEENYKRASLYFSTINKISQKYVTFVA